MQRSGKQRFLHAFCQVRYETAPPAPKPVALISIPGEFETRQLRGRRRWRDDVRDYRTMVVSMSWPQYSRSECTVAGFTIKLTGYEAEALIFLMLRCPNSVSKEELIEWLWPDPGLEPEFTESMVYQTMRRLRAKVGEFHIPSRVNFGYRLMQQPEPERGRERGKRGPCTVFQQAA